jgi:hypothetical protein
LVVKGVLGLDGEYDADLDFDALTNNELRVIKRLSGVRLGELRDALKASDTDVLVAFSVVWLTRAGKNPDVVEELLWAAPVGAIDLVVTEEDKAAARQAEDDARPPVSSPTTSGNESSAVEKPSDSELSPSSTETSRNGGGHLESVPSPTGSPPSDTGAVSAQVI